MEQHRDEPIPCADCGTSFVFSAAEAAVFAERGLAPPKRCKDCRRARKERAARDGTDGPRRSFGSGNAQPSGPRGRSSAGPRYGAPPRRYTGDVNEYRSPMQDGFSGASYGAAPRAAGLHDRPSGPRSNEGGYRPPGWRAGSGEYRSPMQDGLARRGHDGGRGLSGPRPPREEGGFRARPQINDGGRPPYPRSGLVKPVDAPLDAVTPEAGPRPQARKRASAEMFSITCSTCSAQAEVPFKPAEGRDVFCPSCYRARRPTS